jgi:hypothetical protein
MLRLQNVIEMAFNCAGNDATVAGGREDVVIIPGTPANAHDLQRKSCGLCKSNGWCAGLDVQWWQTLL